MIRKNWVSKTEFLFKIIQILGSFLIILLSAILKADLTGQQGWEWLQTIISTSQHHAFWLIPSLMIIVGIVSSLKKHFGNYNTWNTVTYLLEKYKKAIFENKEGVQDDPEYFHRITLYKYVWWRWAFCLYPWDGWMIPVARTGHTTQSMTIPRFRVFLTNPDKAEGVAGQTFVQKRIVPVDNLPLVNKDSADKDKDEYAVKGFVNRNWIEKRKTCHIRSLLGIPIEVKNKPWGVMVIDSRRPEEISSQDVLTTMKFTALAEVLGKLLETKGD